MALRATLLNRTDVAELCQVLTNAGLELVVKTSRKSPPATLVIGDNGRIGAVPSVRFYPLVRFTITLRPHAAQLVDRYSERKEAGGSVNPAIDLSSIATAPKAASS